MVKTVGGAIAYVIHNAALGIYNEQLYLDQAPPTATAPYLTYNDSISTVPALKGDTKALMMTQQVQIDLWESINDESPALLASLVGALDGALLDIEGVAFTPKVAVNSIVRLDEPYDERMVHHAITVEVAHPSSVY